MTRAELEDTKKALRKARRAAMKSPEAARAYLVELGLIDAEGNLTEPYRDEKAAA